MTPAPHCPKCRSTSFQLDETFAEVESRDVVDGVVSATSVHWVDGLISTSCECNNCGHRWAPRKATLDSLERQ